MKHKFLELKIHQRHLDKYKNQYPLIFKEAVMGNHVFEDQGVHEGTLLKLTDERGHFIATGYYGIQNKGMGWVLSKIEKERIDDLFFKKKLYSAIEKRIKLYNNPKTNAFRVFNGEGDGIGGLTIDFYNGSYLINWYSLGIYTFKDSILKGLKEIVEYDAIYEKLRFENDIEEKNDGLVAGNPVPFPIIIKENGEQFAVYFNDGAMVGIFLDQREVRRTIRNNYAKGKNILNLFSYTGAFSVFAAKGGARSTTSVDLANRSLERTQENFKLNNINPEDHNIIVEDVFNYFKFCEKKALKYDMVILDPPSFAKSKDFVFSAEKDYPVLLAETIKITTNNGIIVASNNSSTIDLDKFKQMIGKAFNLGKARFEILEIHQLPKDFRTNHAYPESNYLKVAFIKVIKKSKSIEL